MNVKQGDLAIIVGSDTTPELIGTVVEVIRRSFNGDYFAFLDGQEFPVRVDPDAIVWRVRSSRPLLIRLESAMGNTDDYGTEICMADRHMRPVKGLPMEHESTDEVAA